MTEKEAQRAAMEVKVFTTFEQMEEDEANFYSSLTPQQRLDMMVELISNVIGTRPASRLAGLYPVVCGKRS
jgi:Spy/CpxP family protein refolding chaperone